MRNPKALNRREFLALSASTALAGGRQRRPNILLVVADDLGYSDLGCYGGEIQTPVLDGLAANGLRFAQFYTTARCCPSRASILTGQYPHKVGVGHMVTDLGHPGYRGKLSENAVTLAEVLRSAGYRTFMSGKWHVGTNDPTRHGFEQYYGTLISAATFWDPEKYLRLPQGSRARSYEPNAFYGTDALTDHALDFLADARATPDQPWFLYLAYNAPHFPLHARPEDIAKYRDRYTAGMGCAQAGAAGADEAAETGVEKHEVVAALVVHQLRRDPECREPGVGQSAGRPARGPRDAHGHLRRDDRPHGSADRARDGGPARARRAGRYAHHVPERQRRVCGVGSFRFRRELQPEQRIASR
jgi:hypothetical protein